MASVSSRSDRGWTEKIGPFQNADGIEYERAAAFIGLGEPHKLEKQSQFRKRPSVRPPQLLPFSFQRRICSVASRSARPQFGRRIARVLHASALTGRVSDPLCDCGRFDSGAGCNQQPWANSLGTSKSSCFTFSQPNVNKNCPQNRNALTTSGIGYASPQRLGQLPVTESVVLPPLVGRQ
jgi:hypothetical protein